MEEVVTEERRAIAEGQEVCDPSKAFDQTHGSQVNMTPSHGAWRRFDDLLFNPGPLEKEGELNLPLILFSAFDILRVVFVIRFKRSRTNDSVYPQDTSSDLRALHSANAPWWSNGRGCH